MKTRLRQKGFTLVELLVVITIIAILASVSVPVFGTIQRKAKLNKSLQHGKQIALALRAYASDMNGLYPTGANANEALAKIVPDIESEKIFYVAGCAWHGTGKFAMGPDDLWETSEPKQGKALEGGENHYAYATGFNDSTSSRFPLIASGFTQGSVGQYTNDETEPGGVWAGKNCIVIYCDGSGESPKLDAKDDFKYIDGNGTDVFSMKGLKMVNPLGG